MSFLVLSPDKVLRASDVAPSGALSHWGHMNFVLLRAEYDRAKERVYFEFRARDEDGGDAITTALF